MRGQDSPPTRGAMGRIFTIGFADTWVRASVLILACEVVFFDVKQYIPLEESVFMPGGHGSHPHRLAKLTPRQCDIFSDASQLLADIVLYMVRIWRPFVD